MAFAGRIERGSGYQLGGIALLLAAGSILTALGFQYVGGYQPCALCLEQRYAYYAGIPLLFTGLALSAGGYRGLAAAAFFIVALGFLANAGLGIYHAGAEWKFWPGPDTCGGGQSISGTAGNLVKSLEDIKVPRCDEASLRIFGVSLAGWNAVASLVIAALTLRAAFLALARRTIS